MLVHRTTGLGPGYRSEATLIRDGWLIASPCCDTYLASLRGDAPRPRRAHGQPRPYEPVADALYRGLLWLQVAFYLVGGAGGSKLSSATA
jgi:hypothetical protein